jgi:hypothetical protein
LLQPPKKTISVVTYNFLTVQDEVQPHFDSDMSDVSDEEIHYALNKVGEYSDADDDFDESAAGLGPSTLY